MEPRPEATATTARRTLLELTKIGHVFRARSGEEIAALRDVSLDVSAAEFVSIVGPSGCGKSTLLRIIGGLIPPTTGAVTYRDQSSDGRLPTVGVVFQRPVLFPWRTVTQNVLLPIGLHGSVTPSDREKAAELIAMVGLSGFADSYPFELSGGMQQRAALAGALITDPDVLLMDEPFGALDALTREQLNIELNWLWRDRRTTVILVTHDINEAVFLSTRVLVMTPRPGRFNGHVEMPYEAERSAGLMSRPEFASLTGEIRQRLLGANEYEAGS